jgi:sulfite reductase (ferredoxin)
MEPVSVTPEAEKKPKPDPAELEQDHGKKQRGKGRVGSLENPEVYENVPGHVLPILEREFDDFDNEAAKFLGGEIEEDKFIGFRLKQGVYGQRQPDVQMIRVKLPFGGVTPEQMEAFADLAQTYAPLRKGHITTRQNFQFHHIPLSDAAKAIRVIGDSGLSTREACGNTVRNVTGDPWAGVCDDEPFDITPYAAAYARYFVRHPVTQLMPRKFKTAFAGSDEDRAITGIHDLGFIPKLREVHGEPVRGFEMRVGGGTSIMPRIAPTLSEFVEADNGEYLRVAEAALRIFDRQDWLRKNRARARIKVLVDKIGIEQFRELVDQELEGEWASEHDYVAGLERMKLEHDEAADLPPAPTSYGSPNGDRSEREALQGEGVAGQNGDGPSAKPGDEEFDRFVASNVRPQRQRGFSTIEVKVYRGDLSPEQFRGLARIMREFSGGYARTSIHQNMVLRWVRDESIYDVWERLCELGLGDAGADEIGDVVSCPGTDSCKLGITSSMGLNSAIHQRLAEMQIDDPLTKRIHIKMSGCPNGCAQHHIGNIGFYGASLKVGERQVPAYIPHIGGQYEGGEVAYGERLKSRLPAKRVPDAVERWIRFYEAEREDGEVFNAFVARVGAKRFQDLVKDLAMPVEFGLDNLMQFVDWERKEPYKVERGEGECAV